MQVETQTQECCFIAIPRSLEFNAVREAVFQGVENAGARCISLSSAIVLPNQTIIKTLAEAKYMVADLTRCDYNVYYELGLARAMGKALLLIAHESPDQYIPKDLSEFSPIIYSDSPSSLAFISKGVTKFILEFRKYPQQSLDYRVYGSNWQSFSIDWERMKKSEVENLCRELLAQMGFQHLEWEHSRDDIDLMAEFPRKDPDGFAYSELWLILMNTEKSAKMLSDIAADDPAAFFHRIRNYSKRLKEYYKSGIESPITFLFICLQEPNTVRILKKYQDRFEEKRFELPYKENLRIRVWDQDSLSSLLKQFPQIVYKYFLDESRVRSVDRQTSEQLYKENAQLGNKQAAKIARLEGEKNKRISAERDAMWKDISFSAAHKIGNPIFAIETFIKSLIKRVSEQHTDEALAVIHDISTSVDKAKAFVDQFKSLARAQEIKPIPTALQPILRDTRRIIENMNIDFQIECAPDLLVFADPARLTECFDELISNAIHWLDKAEKKIRLAAVYPATGSLPDSLDSLSKYVLIHVIDNGCGIPTANKEKIFDAFFTTYTHGVGLGLALIRRIIEGHSGVIVETGKPGQGADFNIYLPVPPENEQ